MEYRLRRHDGEYRWILSSGAPRSNAEGSFAGSIGSAIDVTERKLAEDPLAIVSGRLKAQEKERARIARELHDDINQNHALLAIELQGFRDILPDSPANLHNQAQQLFERASEISSAVHVLSHELHSSKLEVLGLVAATRGFCAVETSHTEVKYIDNLLSSQLPE
jgi:signal transduction histidine kinase